MSSVDLRCPVGPRRLLAILRQEGKKPVYLEDNTVEFACSDCARAARREGRDVLRVLHRYNFIGELVDTEEVMRGEVLGDGHR